MYLEIKLKPDNNEVTTYTQISLLYQKTSL